MKKSWRNYRRKEWRDLFVEVAPVSWSFGLTICPTGSRPLYCINIGPFCAGLEYRTKRYKQAIRAAKH